MNHTTKQSLITLLLFTTFCVISPHFTIPKELQVIKPANSLPKTMPWDLKSLSNAPAFKWGDGKKIRSLTYQSEKHKGKPTRIFAYYATPGLLVGDASLDKNLPGIVLVHGGGGKAFSQWAELWAKRGYAAIAMDLSGARQNGGPVQTHAGKFGTITEPINNQWTYHAVANVIRAHSLLRSFPEVNQNKTAMTGISWGGYLTCIVAGLDNRFKAAVPVYGCGFLHENSSWLNEFAKMSADNKSKWVQLWDPSKYVGSTSVPMLFVNGGRDFHYRPDSYAKTYSLVESEKNIRFTPMLRHGHIFDRPKAIEVFINHHLKGGTPLPLISNPVIEEKNLTATVNSKTKLISAKLHYTTDALSGSNKKRNWLELPATIHQNKITSALPPKETVVWFLTVTDDRQTIVSSRIMFSD